MSKFIKPQTYKTHRGAVNNVKRTGFYRAVLENLESRTMLTGTWTPVTNLAPIDTIGSMTVLADGSVFVGKVGQNGRTSQKLIPDATGSYVNGTWSPLAPMNSGHAYASEVM